MVQSAAFYLAGVSLGLSIGGFGIGTVLWTSIPAALIGCVGLLVVQWPRVRSIKSETLDSWIRWWKAIGVPIGAIAGVASVAVAILR